jgi:hypothetical protein
MTAPGAPIWLDDWLEEEEDKVDNDGATGEAEGWALEAMVWE